MICMTAPFSSLYSKIFAVRYSFLFLKSQYNLVPSFAMVLLPNEISFLFSLKNILLWVELTHIAFPLPVHSLPMFLIEQTMLHMDIAQSVLPLSDLFQIIASFQYLLYIKFFPISHPFLSYKHLTFFPQQKNPGNLTVPGHLTLGHNVSSDTLYFSWF